MTTVFSYDNRGDLDYPFGYVYFDDGTRVWYAPGVGESREEMGVDWQSHWFPERATNGHIQQAREFLKAALGVTFDNDKIDWVSQP
jgi:hypothetical protein